MKNSINQDPMFKQLLSLVQNSQMTRRTAIAGLGASAAALSLAACAPASGPKALTPATDLSDTEKLLIWHNWSLYMDEDDNGKYPTLEKFQAQTGIRFRDDPRSTAILTHRKRNSHLVGVAITYLHE